MKRIFKVFAIVMVFCFLLSACSAGDNFEKNILGKWSLDEGCKGYYDLTFFDDGTCIYSDRTGSSCDWAIVNDNKLKLDLNTPVYTISSITSKKMILLDGDTEVTYSKVED